MSVTTSARMNPDQFGTQIPGGAYSKTGARLQDAVPKTITVDTMTDAALQTAINTAAAAFIDRDANATSLATRASNALAANTAFLALPIPTNPQVLAQVQLLSKECSAIIRLLLGQLDDISGT